MEETIKILVENFNIKESKYEFGKQNLTEVTISSLKKILKEFPFGNNVLIPPRIITDKLIIEKHNSDTYFFRNNNKSSYFMRDKEMMWEKKFGHKFTIEELESLFRKKEDTSNLKKFFTYFLGALDRYLVLICFLEHLRFH